ncbi:MAG TPA: FkbM family methyltransferase [Chryseolinea sp.]|nr:FkbM family methyltransferase [Chryseolinea sp.]
MKRIIDLIIRIYLSPLKLNTRLALYVKGKILPYEEHYVATIDTIRRRFGEIQGCILDIGAFDGDSSIYLAKSFPHAPIFAFEPNPNAFEMALKNTRGLANITVHNVALSETEGVAELHVTENSVSSSLYMPTSDSKLGLTRKVAVKVVTLDLFCKDLRQILLLKLDAQGAELGILRSGKKALQHTYLVLTEMLNSDAYVGNCYYYELDKLLRENGFQLHAIFSNYNYEGVKYFDALYINRAFSGILQE